MDNAARSTRVTEVLNGRRGLFSRRAAGHAIIRAPQFAEYFADRGFRLFAWAGAAAIILLVAAIIVQLTAKALPAIIAYDIGFLVDTTWNVRTGEFGVLPQIWGTLYSTALALLIGGFAGLTLAIFLTQGFLPTRLAQAFRTMIEMLAAIPSVVFGIWGIFVVIPAIRPVADWLHSEMAWVPLFSTSFGGPSLLAASLVLAIMILPTCASISQEAFELIPQQTREAAYAMGTTRWEATLKVMVPTAAPGIFAAMVLGGGRAIGETMALAMLIGHANRIDLSLFAPADTLASLLAAHFPEAGPIEVEPLLYAALVLLAISFLVNIAGTMMLSLTQHRICGES
ncbi:MAG: phosphate ABC transporter permease subunit PstC [Rhodospirillales bacterium]|nr:phosphate ABC transporter permease subunit PstC [Rhodospirillales bacterium]